MTAEELPADGLADDVAGLMWTCTTSKEEVRVGDKVAVKYLSYTNVVAEIRPGSSKREIYCRVVSGDPPAGTLFIAEPDELLLKMPSPDATPSCIQCGIREGR